MNLFITKVGTLKLQKKNEENCCALPFVHYGSGKPNFGHSSFAIKLLSMRHCRYDFASSRHFELSSIFLVMHDMYDTINRLHTFSWSNGKLPLSGAVGVNFFWPNVIVDIVL